MTDNRYTAFLAFDDRDGTLPESVSIAASSLDEAMEKLSTILGIEAILSETSEEVWITMNGKEYVYYGFDQE